MQKVIIIDQERLLEYGLDLIEMAIYYYLKSFAKNIKSDTINITVSTILNQIPSLPYKNRKTIYRKIKNIESKGLIKIHKCKDNVYLITIKELVRNTTSKYDMYDPDKIASARSAKI